MDWFEIAATATGVGGFGYLSWWLLQVYIPRIEERHKTERAELLIVIKEISEKADSTSAQFNETVLKWVESDVQANHRLEKIEQKTDATHEILLDMKRG